MPRTRGERMLSRRAALRLLAAGATAGAAAGCDRPREELVPYVAVPEHELPGTPLDYATTLASVHGSGVGVIVTTYTGRPTKIDGNPAHPASLGATGVHAQAALVDLYDSTRSQAPRRGTGTVGLDAFFAELERQVAPLRARGGAGLCVVTPPVASPTAARLLGSLFADLPDARWFRHEPVARDAARSAAVAALGAPLDALYRLERARRVVTLDADLLNGMPGHLAHARRWANARAAPRADMPRLYAIEAQPTPTGIRADQRLALAAARVADFAFGLAAALGVPGGRSFAGSEHEQRWLDALARDLGAQRGASVVVPGPYLPAAVHELCHWINAALAATDGPLEYVRAIESEPVAPAGDVAALCNEIRAGRVAALALVDRNPVYDAPNGAELAELLAHVPFTVHVGARRDETGATCAWHVPLLHDLESWGDLRAFDGTVSISQPVVRPLVAGLSALDVYAALGGAQADTQRAVRDTFERLAADGGDERWHAALRAGVVDG
ncbi:MAG TPA: hypothetical protein VFO94_11630, partial [Gammaproteobacteria bacterium]|nr:hypothetical protein [Gammaproteobacteria bacterium]